MSLPVSSVHIYVILAEYGIQRGWEVGVQAECALLSPASRYGETLGFSRELNWIGEPDAT